MALRASHEHLFACRLAWTGAQAGGTTAYGAYSRELRVDIEGKPSLTASAAAAFRGDPALYNPEDMLMAALCSCHCLSYLALAALGQVVVLGYEDEASGVMTKVDGKMRFREVTLHPRVWVAPATDVDLATQLHHRAHEECFIASSVNFPVRNEPTVLVGLIGTLTSPTD